MKSILNTIALMGLAVSALPSNLEERSFSTNGKKCKKYSVIPSFANFDNIAAPDGSSNNAIPQPYNALAYPGFTVANPASLNLGLLSGVGPHSEPNYIVARGTGRTSATTVLITTIFPGNAPDVKVSLKSFYYGCTSLSLLGGLIAFPARCTVTVQAYKGKTNTVATSQRVCTHTYEFVPASLLGTQPGFYTAVNKDCDNADFLTITFTPINPGLLSGAVALTLDDVAYDLRRCIKY